MARATTEISVSEREAICAMYRSGTPTAKIGAAFGISSAIVSKLARLGGEPPRQRRGSLSLDGLAFDPSKLAIEEYQGEPRVVDIVLGAALGYGRWREIRQQIKRLERQLSELGKLPLVAATSHMGRGARQVYQYLLNQAQLNYLITRCGLAKADDACVHIARVFTAWQQATLVATSYETAVELEESREAAAIAAPELARLQDDLHRMLSQAVVNLATKDDLREVKHDLSRLLRGFTRRKDVTKETRSQHVETCKLYFSGKCPCCGDRPVVKADGTIAGHVDHWTDNAAKNAAHETWLICPQCNSDFESGRLTKADYRAEFDVFQKRRKQLAEADGQLGRLL